MAVVLLMLLVNQAQAVDIPVVLRIGVTVVTEWLVAVALIILE